MNPNTWSKAKLAIGNIFARRPQVAPYFIAVQEAPLEKAAEIDGATRWATSKVVKLAVGRAKRTGPGPLETSAGAAVSIARSIGSAESSWVQELFKVASTRIIGQHVNAFFPDGFEWVSLYIIHVGVRGHVAIQFGAYGGAWGASRRIAATLGYWDQPQHGSRVAGEVWLVAAFENNSSDPIRPNMLGISGCPL